MRTTGHAIPLNPRDWTLERLAARRIEADRLLPAGESVLVAVSGGPDSVALLHFLRAEGTSSGRAGTLAAAHVNHGLRGDASSEDAAFVRRIAEAWDVPYFEAALPKGALARSGAAGSADALAPEDAARRLRYAALRSLAARAGAGVIAVAHTADDQAETLLLRMARGSGLRGLAGMAPRRPLGDAQLVRPLLDVSREQVLDYLRRHAVAYREDASNQSLGAARNYVRHEILPRLRDRLNPSVREALLRQAALFREADGYLEAEASRALPEVTVLREEGKIVLEAARLLLYPKLLRSYIFRRALQDLDGAERELTAAHVDVLHSLVTQPGGRTADLPMGIQARRERGRVILASHKREPAGHNIPSKLGIRGVSADSRKGTTSE